MIKIFSPIWIKDRRAYFSISQWNFDKEKSNEILVLVYDGDKVAGKGTIDKKKWIRTSKLKESKIVFRPTDPMIYYYNIMKFDEPLTEENKLKKFCQENY